MACVSTQRTRLAQLGMARREVNRRCVHDVNVLGKSLPSVDKVTVSVLPGDQI